MGDQGYNPHNEEMLQKLHEWAELTAEKILAKELDDKPDVVGFFACLQYAARKVALRRDLMSVEMAKQIFANILKDICPDNAGKA